MIGVVVITHGSLASGLESAVSLLAGKPDKFAIAELHPGDTPGDFKSRVETAVASVDDGEGVLALVDIFGGTPSNTISQLFDRDDVRAVAGTNLPMVIQALFMRESVGIEELPSQVLEAGNEALVDIRQKFVEALQSQDDEEDF